MSNGSVLIWGLTVCKDKPSPLAGKVLCMYLSEIMKTSYSTVNPEIFSRILVSRYALKDIFATLKIRDYGMVYLQCISLNDRMISPFREDFVFTKFAKFRENKTLAIFSEFTVYKHSPTTKPIHLKKSSADVICDMFCTCTCFSQR